MYFGGYTLCVTDKLEFYYLPLSIVKQMVVNFDECLTEDGALTAGTTWFKVSEVIKPCTRTKEENGLTTIAYDGKYRVSGFGGYQPGYGCFFKEIK